MKCNWYALYVKTRHEKKVYDQLQYENITTFLPMHQVVRQWHDRSKKVTVPLIPNYLFVSAPLNDRWRILNIRGVVDFVKHEGSPAVIPARDINIIEKMVHEDVLVADRVFLQGNRVIVTKGPFKDLEGKVVKQNAKTKLALLLDSIRTTFIVEVPSGHLRLVPD